MIRIDLLKDFEEESLTEAPAESKKAKSSKKIWLVVAMVLVLAAGGWFSLPFVQDLLKGGETVPVLAKKKAVLKKAVKPTGAIAVPKGRVVEEGLQVRAAAPRPPLKKTASYRQLQPMERVQYQKVVMAEVLQKILNITPESVGYEDLVVRIPDHFYLKALGRDSAAVRSFLTNLGNSSGKLKTLENKRLRKGGSARSFSAYGNMFVSPQIGRETPSLVKKAEEKALMLRLTQLAKNNKVELRQLKESSSTPHGIYRRKVYRAQIETDFQSLLSFLKNLRNNRLRVGVLQISMRATRQESMKSTIDFVLYTDS